MWLLSSLFVKSLYACASPWVYLSRQATLALCVKCVSEYTMRGRFQLTPHATSGCLLLSFESRLSGNACGVFILHMS